MKRSSRKLLGLAAALLVVTSLSGCSIFQENNPDYIRSEAFREAGKVASATIQEAATSNGLPGSTPVLGSFDAIEGGYAVLITRPSNEPQATDEDDPTVAAGGVRVILPPLAMSADYDTATIDGTVEKLKVTFGYTKSGYDRRNNPWSEPYFESFDVESQGASGGTSETLRQDEVSPDDPRPYK